MLYALISCQVERLQRVQTEEGEAWRDFYDEQSSSLDITPLKIRPENVKQRKRAEGLNR